MGTRTPSWINAILGSIPEYRGKTRRSKELVWQSVLTRIKTLCVPQPGNRTLLLCIGTAFVSLMAVGVLLLTDRPSVSNAAEISNDSDQSIVTARGSSFENQIQELRLENDSLQNNLEISREETDNLRKETLQLNKELLRLELALMKTNEGGEGSEGNEGPDEITTIDENTDVPVGSSIPDESRNPASIQSASITDVESPDNYLVEQESRETTEETTDETINVQTNGPRDLLGRTGELEIEVYYEYASPADQQAYDEHISNLGHHVSYTDFRFSDSYKPKDIK